MKEKKIRFIERNKLTWLVCFETKLQPDEDEDSTALPTQSSVSAMF